MFGHRGSRFCTAVPCRLIVPSWRASRPDARRLSVAAPPPLNEEPARPSPLVLQVVMQLVDSMVKRTNEQLTESTSLLQDVLRAAADPQARHPTAGTAKWGWQAANGVLRAQVGSGRPGASPLRPCLPESPPAAPSPRTPLSRRASGSCRSRPTSWRQCGA